MDLETMRPLLRIFRLNLVRYRAALRTLNELAGYRSKCNFLWHVLKNCSFTQLAAPTAENAPLIRLRMKALGPAVIHCRSGLSDLGVVYDTFVGRYHLPPEGLSPVRSILDLGSNIGITMAHFAVLNPEARILGVELDQTNHELCRMNIDRFGERCQVIHAAVWCDSGEARYAGVRESGYAVVTHGGGPVRGAVRTVTMESLIDYLGVDSVDFVKMDIEGAEKEVLQNARSWLARVRCIKVEVHPEKTATYYSLGMCVEDLERHGMACTLDPRHHACVVGFRSDCNERQASPAPVTG